MAHYQRHAYETVVAYCEAFGKGLRGKALAAELARVIGPEAVPNQRTMRDWRRNLERGLRPERGAGAVAWVRPVVPGPKPFAAAGHDAPASAPLAPHETEIEEDGDTLRVRSNSWRITTLDELLAYHRIDTAVWEPDRPKVGYHEGFYKTPVPPDQDGESGPTRYEERLVGMHRISCSLRRRVPQSVAAGLDLLADRFRATAPKLTPHRRRAPRVPHMLEVSLYDHHFAKLAWSGETGEDWDLRISDQVYRLAVDDVLDQTSRLEFDQVLFPVGNDLFNYDSARGDTAGGTPQDNDSRLPKVYDVCGAAVIYAIERLRQVAPVHVVYVPGNHDPNLGYLLCSVLRAHFHTIGDEVTFDAGPRQEKAFRYGDNFIGLCHGQGSRGYQQNLPNLFAIDDRFRRMWGECSHIEIHKGHFHKREEMMFMPLEKSGGVSVRTLPSLCGRDAWHAMKGYTGGPRATDTLVWTKDRGPRGYFITYAEELLARASGGPGAAS